MNSWNSGDDDGWLSYSGGMWSAGFEILADVFTSTEPEDALSLTLQGEYSTVTLNRSISTALVGRVALTNDIPDMSGYVTPADVTAAIREQSLGGIWDQQLEVWWTPVMVNGALTYQATTNVNLNAEGN